MFLGTPAFGRRAATPRRYGHRVIFGFPSPTDHAVAVPVGYVRAVTSP
ncbi:hypothetical protein ACSDR0_41490 [Streptosporangium sp. G11]